MTKIQTQPIVLRDIGSNGVLMPGVVSEVLLPQGTVSDVLNLHFDKIGTATLRKGLLQLGNQLTVGKSILAIHQFLDQGAGTDDKLIAVNNNTAYYFNGATWVSNRTGLTIDSKARFTNFIDLVFMVNGTEPMNTWNGANASPWDTTNAVSAPTAKYIDNFRSRVWVANTATNPSRLFYSSIASTTNTILWTGNDSSFIDVSPGDGEDIVGIRKFSKALWVFKNNFMYPVFSISQTTPDPQIFVGTYSQESIQLAKDGMYWHHSSGIYRMRRGENQPTEISKPINDIIENIPRNFYEEITSWHDDDHIYFSIGNVSVNGNLTQNCVIRFTISSEVWTIYSYIQGLRVGNTYDNGTSITQIIGDTNGKLYTYNSGTFDDVANKGIPYRLEIGPLTLSGLESQTKTIRRLGVLHKQAQGGLIGMRVDDMEFNDIKKVGQLKESPTIFNSIDITGNKIYLNLTGVAKSEQFEFNGFEILDWLNEGVID